ncbi:pneumococcal-type histidine triad protein [Carnobacteriaceae bacterium zg-84]|uniref:pneumococcal-type histidine triad protein n=1 Tax=Granulicatella sp. zg-84 TaxID=2678503 RepID=UPI0013D0FDC2|nr:pneumococcal-type histidine triad protein [Granulicatella sp. zg-84]QMI85078.1 pneumococcal-type histidine triad protein [Carnobacteriaceae bacterium zg-84]
MKRKHIIIGTVGAVALTSVCAFALLQSQSNNVTKMEAPVSNKQTENTKDKTALYETIANQIKQNKPVPVVGRVFENGYLLKHGNHYHFVHGKVPENAIFEKMVEKQDYYVFDPKDIVEENELGYVVRHGDHFHFIPKGSVNNGTTIAHHDEHKVDHEHDDYVFSPSDVVGETETGYIVRHGDHFHFIPKGSVNNGTTIAHHDEHEAGHDHEHDDYVFSPSDVVGETETGYIVRHGDHFHFIPKGSVNNGTTIAHHDEHEAAHDHEHGVNDIVNKEHESDNTHEGHEHHDADNSMHDDNEHHSEENEHHQFAFDPKDIVSEDEEGYVVRHGDHFHYVYKKDLPSDFVKPHEEEETEEPKIEEPKTEEPKPEEPTNLPDDLEEKINYIIAAYGVPREAIKVHNGYFVFNEPTHEYDPSHIHPYAIPINKLKIPVMTDDKEADFENEWLSIAERMGVSPEQLEIKDGYFVISHGDHSHYVKIMSGGEKEYFKNKLPDIVGAFVRGDLDKDVVINKAQDLEKQAEDTYKDDPKQLRRIKTALRQFKEKVALGGNSTQGYLDMLTAFEKQYISLNEEEALSEEDQALAQKHSELVDKINRLNLSRFSITKENLLDKLYKISESKNLQRLNDLDIYINGFNDLRARPGITGLQFLDYLLAHVDDRELSYDTREFVSDAIYESYEASIMNRKSIFSIFHLIADAKDAIRLSHETPAETNNTITGPKYARLDEPFEWRVPSVREDAKRFVEDVRGLIGPTDPTPTPSNFKEKPVSDTPKEDMVVNSVEDDTTGNAVSEEPKSNEEVSTSEMPEVSSETEEKESSDAALETNNEETASDDSDVVRIVNPNSEEVEENSTEDHH